METVVTKLTDECEKYIKLMTANQRREVVLSELKRKNKIKTLFKDCSVAEMSDIIERLQSFLEEKKIEENERFAREDELRKEAQAILDEMMQKGINVELLKDLQQQAEQNSTGSKVKYVKDGLTWSGQGRRPTPFKGLSDYELEKYRKFSEE